MKTQNTQNQQVMVDIIKVYSNLNEKILNELIEKTNQYGLGYLKINGYKSDVSNGTETANQLINIGMNYEKAVEKSLVTYDNVDLSKINIDKHDYSTINTNGLSLSDYKQAVKNSLELALSKLKEAPIPKTTNDVYLNKVLVFNYTTLKLSIVGKSESKTVEIKGDFNVTKKAPLTLAKEFIKRECKAPTNSMRRFKVDNITNVKFSGNTIELE
jgi:hypothetical protein